MPFAPPNLLISLESLGSVPTVVRVCLFSHPENLPRIMPSCRGTKLIVLNRINRSIEPKTIHVVEPPSARLLKPS